MCPPLREGVGEGGGGGCVEVGKQLPSLRHPIDQVATGGHRQPGVGGDQEAAAGQGKGGCDEGKSVKKSRDAVKSSSRTEWSSPLLVQPSISVSNDSHLVPVQEILVKNGQFGPFTIVQTSTI